MQGHSTGRQIACFPAMDRQEFYRTLHRTTEPFIIRDAVGSWPAWSKWSFPWLRENHGHVVVPVEWLRYARQEQSTAKRIGRVEEKPLADFIDSLFSGEPGDKGYVIGADILRRVPSLMDDVQFPRYHDVERLVERIAFIGGKGTYTQLHYDRAHNLHAVLVGRKRWQIYGPAQSRRLRPVKLSFIWSVVSDHDLVPVGGRAEDVSGLPDDMPGGATPDYDILLEAGEILFLPYGWWHRVITLEPSIAVNYWWWPLTMVAKRAPFLLPSLVASRIQDRLRRPIRRGYYGE
jgi:hypothetical protein